MPERKATFCMTVRLIPKVTVQGTMYPTIDIVGRRKSSNYQTNSSCKAHRDVFDHPSFNTLKPV
jgi:hypothetical protein